MSERTTGLEGRERTPRLLVVDDDPATAQLIRQWFAGSMEVLDAVDGKQGLERAFESKPDLLLLDLRMPGLDGIAVAQQLKADSRTRAIPIVVLSACRDAESKVEAFSAGADDYVTKPFGSKELLARVEALARRAQTSPEPPQTIETDGCRIDIGRLVANRDDRKVILTAREANILSWLHAHRTRGVSRAELLTEVWGASADQQTRTVDMTIANLRQKIETDPSSPRIVVTVKGLGYAWGPE